MTDAPINPFTAPRWLLEDGKLGTGKTGRIEATPEESQQAARALDLLECRNLVLTYHLKAMQPIGFRMRAEVKADVVQACVITTEPVQSSCREEVDVDLIPATTKKADEVLGTVDVLSDSVAETYSEGRIDLGQYAFELLSTSIDPYPRKPGAEFVEPGAEDKIKLSPFAVLGKLRGK